MCLRLFAALSGNAADVAGLAFEAGLDLRIDPREGNQPGVRLVELAWGDCACALATSRDGGERVGAFAEGLIDGGGRVQLLLVDEREEPCFGSLPVNKLPLSTIRSQGLAALDRGRAVEVTKL